MLTFSSQAVYFSLMFEIVGRNEFFGARVTNGL